MLGLEQLVAANDAASQIGDPTYPDSFYVCMDNGVAIYLTVEDLARRLNQLFAVYGVLDFVRATPKDGDLHLEGTCG